VKKYVIYSPAYSPAALRKKSIEVLMVNNKTKEARKFGAETNDAMSAELIKKAGEQNGLFYF